MLANLSCYQLGFITDSAEKLIPQLKEYYNVPEFFVFPDIKFNEVIFRGQPASCRISIAIGYSGPVQIEVVECLSGIGAYSEFLQNHGPGLHHVGFLVDDFDAALEKQLSMGLTIIQTGVIGDEKAIRFAYIDTVETLGVVTEIIWISKSIAQLYKRLQDRASRLSRPNSPS